MLNEQDRSRNCTHGNQAATAMTVITAWRLVFSFLFISAWATVVPFAAWRFSHFLGITHTAAAALYGRHEQQQCEYEYQ